ncbi:MAG: hypothetical protein HWQ41_09090 [Nostoc sp. NOS(2021)]|uniref:hypothetical protein n=1 Tax=Nostoc sp. NOS(2021) TaxID=2815407 RepID=UPI0025FF126F|nr:hypothetical protein [Nostoc sp. NOS(2021)]MBN3895403.1 hypothetical protein [Nostoc sp. NOS(2021)]
MSQTSVKANAAAGSTREPLGGAHILESSDKSIYLKGLFLPWRGTLMKLGLHQSAVEIFDRYEVKGQLGQVIRLATYLELMPTPARNFVNGTEWFTEEILKRIAGG